MVCLVPGVSDSNIRKYLLFLSGVYNTELTELEFYETAQGCHNIRRNWVNFGVFFTHKNIKNISRQPILQALQNCLLAYFIFIYGQHTLARQKNIQKKLWIA